MPTAYAAEISERHHWKGTWPVSFGAHVHRAVMQALKTIPTADAPGIYALSFFIYDQVGAPQQPALTIGYNTEYQVKLVLGDTSDPGGRRCTDPAQARWDYAYWLQNELAVIGDSNHDPEGAAQRARWIQDTPRFRGHPELVTARFVVGCVRMAHSLHEVGLIERAVGRPVPVLIHGLEDQEQTVRQTEAANPPGFADDFAAWARRQ